MSNTKNAQKLQDDRRIDVDTNKNSEDAEMSINTSATPNHSYAVTVSKKVSPSGDVSSMCCGQKSFISIHSTDHLCQVADIEQALDLNECNVEVISRNEVFPSTSEESLCNDESPIPRKQKNLNKNKNVIQTHTENATKPDFLCTVKSSTSNRRKQIVEGQGPIHSDFDIPKNTLYVVGSNPGEPKITYQDPPKKISKTMKKFLRTIDKHKNDQIGKCSEKVISKLTTMRGILKDSRCGPECTGDSSVQSSNTTPEDILLPFSTDLNLPLYTKQNQDKNVTFNTQVVIIHFTGDLCVGQSIEALSKERDQQARNSELRKTFLTKYNEFWPTENKL